MNKKKNLTTKEIFALAVQNHQKNNLQVAESFYKETLKRNPKYVEAHNNLGGVMHGQRKYDEAAECYRASLQIQPGDAEIRHLLAACIGGLPDAAPDQYVSKMFDKYAGRFDRLLTETLQFKGPQMLRDAVGRLAGGKEGLRILDLGCGTGLCGPHFRDMASALIGVDLSPRMIEKARERGIYDDLIVGNITESLRGEKGAFDLILASDVFVYVGNLDQVFAGCRDTLRGEGIFAFSTEHAEGDSYILRPSARFAHSAAYIKRMAAAHGFSVEISDEVILRTEHNMPVTGEIFALRRKDEAPLARRPAGGG